MILTPKIATEDFESFECFNKSYIYIFPLHFFVSRDTGSDPFAVGRGDLDPLRAGSGGGMIMDPLRAGRKTN